MRTNLLTLFTLLVATWLAVPAFAGGDAASGEKKSTTCQACHGMDGRGTDPTYPVLAGQHESYLAQALTDYRDGNRKNPIMSGMAINLSNQDIEDLAAWYASLDGLQDLSIK